MEYVQLLGGLLILIASGEALVKGAVGIALKLHVSTLVIGMTIVSFGTSAPELLVAIKAALLNKPDITVGAIIGSNVSNITFILGLTALVFPISVNRDSLAIDWPMMMLTYLLFYLAIFNGSFSGIEDGNLSGVEGLMLFGSLILFGTWLIMRSRKKTKKNLRDQGYVHLKTSPVVFIKYAFLIILGCIGLVYGAELFVLGADQIARNFNISERVIGLTLVAFGTSLPELITSLIAAFRKQADIGIGNLIGSNIFNILSILGITAMIKPINVDFMFISMDFLWMLVGSVIIFPMMFFGRRISRIEGFLLMIFYLSYLYFVFKN